jgi:hypothetical protein
VEKNEPNAFGKGHADKQAFNLDRNVFAFCRQNCPRENLVSGRIYRFMTFNTSKKRGV